MSIGISPVSPTVPQEDPEAPSEQAQPDRFLVTDLNFENDVDYDNLEAHLDQQFNAENDEQFQNDLLFAVQGLGGVKKFNDLEIYIKNAHCEESLKELIRILKKDDPDHPFARLELSKWNVLASDLLPLILTQPQDKKLSFYVIVLLVQMTEYPSKGCYKSDFLVSSLQSFKLAFLQDNVIKTLMIHLADCISVEPSSRNKIHENMIELIVTLLRNLVRIPDLEDANNAVYEFRRNLQVNLLLVFAKDSVFDALIYLCQDMASVLMMKLNLVFLEIFYHIFSSFKPSWIMSSGEEDRKQLEMLEDSARRGQIKRINELGTRHSRFGTNLCIKRLLGGGFKVLSNPFKTNAEVNHIPNQRNKPIQRKFGMNFPDIYKKSLNEDLKVSGVDETDSLEAKTLKTTIRNFSLDFLEHAYGNLLESLYDEIYKDSERIQEDDVIAYFVVMGFGLGLARNRFYMQRKEKQLNKENVNQLNIDLEPIIQALQLTQFELLYSQLVREVTRPKKKMVQYRLFYAAAATLLEVLYVTQELSMSNDSMLRKNAQSLMQNIFHHDITRIIRVGFVFCVPGLLGDNLLKTLIELQMIFFDLLETFSRGKVLTIQTDRRIKRKKEAAKKARASEPEGELNDFIEKDNEDPDGDQEYDPFKKEAAKPQEEGENKINDEEEDSEDEEGDREDEPLFQERKFNFMSEFAMIADYGVLSKMFWLISGEQLLTNDKQLNLGVYKYLKKVLELMKADWMFFQIDYLHIMHGIISNSEIRNKLEFRNYMDLIRKILKSFFNSLQKNKFLLVEALFRFTDKTIKDSILSNYEDDMEMTAKDGPQKQFEDPDDYDFEAKGTRTQAKQWYKLEDQTLIQNYDQFKDLPNCEDHLCLLINNMGFSDKEPLDVRRRIKYLKLNKGADKAKEIFNEIYENQKVSFNLAVKNYLENCKQEKLSKEDLIVFLQEKLEKFKEFKKIISVTTHTNIDFALVPLGPKDFDILESPVAQQVFLALELRPPAQGEWMWRVPGYFTVNDVEGLFERLKAGLEGGIMEGEIDEGLKKVVGTFRDRMEREEDIEEEEYKEEGDNNEEEYKEEIHDDEGKNNNINRFEDNKRKSNEEEENEEEDEYITNNKEQKNQDYNEESNKEHSEYNEENHNDKGNEEDEEDIKSQQEPNNNNEENNQYNEENISQKKDNDEDEGENFFDINEEVPKKDKKSEFNLTLTVPLATLEGGAEELNSEVQSKAKWVEQTQIIPTLNPENN